MRSKFASRLRAEAGRLKRRFVPTGVILMYHRVADVASDPWELTVSPAAFEQQLQMLKSHGVRLLTAADMAAAVADNQLPRRSVAISFDDGYLDNLTVVRPLLERYDAPATVFVSSGEIGRPDGFWWDRLGNIVFHAERLPDQLQVGCQTIAASSFQDDRRGLSHALWRALVDEEQEVRDARLDELAIQLGAGARSDDLARIMTEEELRRLSDGGLVEVGAHGWSHRPLGELPPREQHQEARRSRERLDEILGAPVAGISYPHGSTSPDTFGIVHEAGFAYACGSRPGLVRRGAEPFDLPRMEIQDGSAETFDRFLADHVLS